MNKFYLLLLCCVVLFKASGQPGSLDSTFGNNGIQTTAFFNNANSLTEEGREVLTSAKGDIFVVVHVDYSYTRIAKYFADGRLDSSYGNAGFSNAAKLNIITSAVMQEDKIIVGGDLALVRYNADGRLDSSFGENGIVTTISGIANSIILQENKILVAGSINDTNGSDFALARYTSDGKLDSSFGRNGIVRTDFSGSYDVATSMVLQGDKIIVAGYTYYGNQDFALARYTSDGKVDNSFGVNGRVLTDFSGSYDIATSIALQGDKIIAGGTSNSDFALARFTANGRLDSSFGENGLVTTNFNSSYIEVNSIAVQGDRIVMAGTTYNNSPDFALARYTADGKLDASFGEDGKIVTDFNSYEDYATSIVLQGYKILVVGYTGNFGNYDFALTRYTANGVLDASFGDQGLIKGYFSPSYTFFTSTVIQGNKIIAAGYTLTDNNTYSIVLVRYTSPGILDSTFGENGKVIAVSGVANSIILQGDKILVAGSNGDFILLCYTADGGVDSSFGVNGIVTTDFNSDRDVANSIALHADKIILAGYATNPNSGNYDFALARYTANGVLDSSFGENGLVTTNFVDGSWDGAHSIAIQGDKILVAGSHYSDFLLVRYTSDGKLDASFGKDGVITTDFRWFDAAYSIALQGDKILVGGYAGDDFDGEQNFITYFALARYTLDGVLDSSFGVYGKVTTDFSSSDDFNAAFSMTLQGDKIILGGYTENYEDLTTYFALARYTTDGALDASFGEDGKVITYLGGNARLQAIALHQNRLYAVGSTTVEPGITYGVVAAYQLEAPAPAITITDVTVQESKKLAILTARISKPTNQIVRVHFTTRDKTAVRSQDYISISGPLFFIPGVNRTAKIIIPIIDNSKPEGTEQFEIVLSDAHNATIQDSIGVVTIVDDDAAPVAKQNASLHIHVSPNPSASIFTVQLQSTNLKQPISIRIYDVSGRMIEQRENISIGQSLHLGEQYKTGTYIIEAVQGSQKLQIKVIKTGK